MINQKRLFKKEYSVELLTIAKGDFESAKVLAGQKTKGRPENVIFLAQQSVEKAVKSALVFLQIPFPLVHDLGILVALLPDAKMPPKGFNLSELNPFASIRRYEEGLLPITESEVSTAMSTAQEVLQWAEKLMGSK